MSYTINQLAQLAGLTPRALRWYDQRGLLKPARIAENGYRLYGQEEVSRLQQILFYRELGMPLAAIAQILDAPDFDGLAALQGHLAALQDRRAQLDRLIATVDKSIRTLKGETAMTDQEKFEGFKQQRIAENEARYGQEIRAKYGDAAIDATNAKLKGMTQAQHTELERLTAELNETLKAACTGGDPGSALAQKAADLHRQWLSCYWPQYTKAAHRGVAAMYVADERFTAYYEKIAPGCAAFLCDAVAIYCGE
ncbi:MAG: MerR family transcriptional regulator [Oscillospiraceae bacterium]|jgi:DNA-binding transcriptional MerR regulator|nr:MerR family transcriptional regulator [Oscillospiraceae bacterium]